MIHALRVSDPALACIPWWKNVSWLKGQTTIEFKPGLNILWGPNGAGKSTVLKAIARMLHCEQAGVQVVTEESTRQVFSGSFGPSKDRMMDGVMPVHDGQPVLMYDPGRKVGLVGGGAAFDFDFLMEGVQTVFAERASSGEQTLRGIDGVLGPLVSGKFPGVEWKIKAAAVNDLWQARLKQIEPVLQGTPSKKRGKKTATVLLDEPDRSMSLVYQGNLWLNLAEKAAPRTQIIAASHSPFALGLPGAHYIETVPGYLDQCLRAVRDLGSRVGDR